MKLIYIFIPVIVIAMVIVFNSCKTTSSTKQTAKEGQDWISLKAGKCFGKCKVYDLKIDQTGKSELNAIRNMPNLGVSQFELSKDVVKELTSLFEEQAFSTLENEYLSGAKDLQLFEITYEGKTVKFHKMKAPQNLKNILNKLYSLVDEN